MSFATSQRDLMLDALVAVLQQMDGLNYVDRQAITPELVADSRMPAVLIDEVRSDYQWLDRHGSRSMRVRSVIVLDLQARAVRRTDGQGANISTARERFTNAVLDHLANNPNLIVQLASEDEAADHAYDVMDEVAVRYVRMKDPYVRTLITVSAIPCAQVYDDRTYTDWQTLILDTYTDRELGEPVTTTYDLE